MDRIATGQTEQEMLCLRLANCGRSGATYGLFRHLCGFPIDV